jgi:hypothetical protein
MRRLLAAVVLLAAVGHAAPASASWTATAAGTGRGRTTVLGTPGAPSVTIQGSNARLQWNAVLDSRGLEVVSYSVNRYRVSDGALTAGVCTATAPTRACTDGALAKGVAVRYTVVAVKGWSVEGAQSSSVTR